MIMKFNGNFGFNASKIKADKDRSRDAYYEILKKVDSKKAEDFYKIFYLDAPYCPKCHSLNIGYEFVQDSAKTKGKAEVRKSLPSWECGLKSAILLLCIFC